MRATRLFPVFFALALALGGCAGTPRSMNTGPHGAGGGDDGPPVRHEEGGEFHVIGSVTDEHGGDAYDATLLFDRANAAVRTGRCEAALPDYERLIREFPTAASLPSAFYNRGMCLQGMGRVDDAVESLREAARRATDRGLVRMAWFRVAHIGESAQRPPLVIEATNAILMIPNLAVVDRVEALARQSAAVLAQGDRLRARDLATQASALVPTPESIAALEDDTFVAEAKFIAAETFRLDAQDVAINVNDANFEDAITRRVQLVTHAHALYNDSIRVGHPHWAAACGYSIGEMYRGLYDAIVNAQTPPDWDANAIAIYRRRVGQRLRPLLEGALRAWEATLTMARRNGISDNTWVQRTGEEIDSLRALITAPPGTPAGNPPPAHDSASTPRGQHAL